MARISLLRRLPSLHHYRNVRNSIIQYDPVFNYWPVRILGPWLLASGIASLGIARINTLEIRNVFADSRAEMPAG